MEEKSSFGTRGGADVWLVALEVMWNICDFITPIQNIAEINKLSIRKGEWHGESQHVRKDGRMITVEP